jgi:hypothetical protein
VWAGLGVFTADALWQRAHRDKIGYAAKLGDALSKPASELRRI